MSSGIFANNTKPKMSHTVQATVSGALAGQLRPPVQCWRLGEPWIPGETWQCHAEPPESDRLLSPLTAVVPATHGRWLASECGWWPTMVWYPAAVENRNVHDNRQGPNH